MYERAKLVQLVLDLLRHVPRLTEAEASERLHVHRHTLQRALKENNCSFALATRAAVLDRLECHFASADSKSLKQVWTELGFPSSSAFARYIRHATGKSPSELRANRQLHKDQGQSTD
jgi:AraC-like DNA-binding protein